MEQEAGPQYGLLRARVRQGAAAGVDDELVPGRFEADHGDARSAVRRLREEWRRQPGTAVTHALGWALHRGGQDEEALDFALEATEAARGGGVRNALYAYHRGMIEQSLGLPGPAASGEGAADQPVLLPAGRAAGAGGAGGTGRAAGDGGAGGRHRIAAPVGAAAGGDGGDGGDGGPPAARVARRAGPPVCAGSGLTGCRGAPARARSPRTGP